MRLRLTYLLALFFTPICVMGSERYVHTCRFEACPVDTLPVGRDSLTAKQLREAVVKADRGWVEKDKIVFLPTRKEKTLSNSPVTLIKAMHLPFLREKDGLVTNISGEEVTYFINGVKAEKTDISTFWPSQVKRVEYLENPSDPTFEGAKVAVNFIMPEYAVGGVTRLDFYEKMPNSSKAEAATKLVYKKHTFGISLSPEFERIHGDAQSGTETYKNIYYNGTPYSEINRMFTENNYERKNDFNFVLNAKYRTNKFRATHGFSLYWKNDLGSGGNSTDAWSENLFSSTTSAHYSEGKSVKSNITGDYSLTFSEKWYLTTRWGYAYTHSNKLSWTRYQESEKISNRTKEDIHSANFFVMPSFFPSEKFAFQWQNSVSLDWFTSIYSGATNVEQRQVRQDLSSVFKMMWKPVSAFSITPNIGVLATLWKIGDEKYNSVQPYAGIYAKATLSKKLFLSGNVSYHSTAPSAGETSTVMMKSTELLWIKGTPTLKSQDSWSGIIDLTYLTNKWLSLSFHTDFIRMGNISIPTYVVAPREQGGLIKSEINADPFDLFDLSLSMNFRMLDGDLSLHLYPYWRYCHMRGAYAKKYYPFSFNGSIDYTLGNCNFTISYEGPTNAIYDAGMQKYWCRDRWNAEFTYGKGNWYFNIAIEDIFNRKAHSWKTTDAGNYFSHIDMKTWGRSLVLNLTYTFGYGKKVDRSIDIQGSSQIKTSIVGTKE